MEGLFFLLPLRRRFFLVSGRTGLATLRAVSGRHTDVREVDGGRPFEAVTRLRATPSLPIDDADVSQEGSPFFSDSAYHFRRKRFLVVRLLRAHLLLDPEPQWSPLIPRVLPPVAIGCKHGAGDDLFHSAKVEVVVGQMEFAAFPRRRQQLHERTRGSEIVLMQL